MKHILIIQILCLMQQVVSQNKPAELVGSWKVDIKLDHKNYQKSEYQFNSDSSFINLNYYNDTLTSVYLGVWKVKSSQLILSYNECFHWITTGYYKRKLEKVNSDEFEFNIKNNKLILSTEHRKENFSKHEIEADFMENFHKKNIEYMFEASENYFFNRSSIVTSEIHLDLLDYYQHVHFDKDDRRMFVLYKTQNETNLKIYADRAFEENDYWLAYWYYRILYLRKKEDEVFEKAMLAWNLNNNPVQFRDTQK